jgi:hypothetical protein
VTLSGHWVRNAAAHFAALLMFAAPAAGALSDDDQACLGCHGQAGLTKAIGKGETLQLQLEGAAFERSVHAGERRGGEDRSAGLALELPERFLAGRHAGDLDALAGERLFEARAQRRVFAYQQDLACIRHLASPSFRPKRPGCGRTRSPRTRAGTVRLR